MAIGNAIGSPLSSSYGGTAVSSAGTSGNVLKSNGSTWSSTSIGGSLYYLTKQTFSGSSAVSFDLSGYSYNNFFVEFIQFVGSTSSTGLGVQLSTDTGGTFITSGYKSMVTSYIYNSTSNTDTAQSSMIIMLSPSNSAVGMSGSGYIFNINSANMVVATSQFVRSAGGQGFGAGFNTAGTNVNYIKFVPTSGTVSGTIALYALKTSA